MQNKRSAARCLVVSMICGAAFLGASNCYADRYDDGSLFCETVERQIREWGDNPRQPLRLGDWELLRLAPATGGSPNQHPVSLSPELISKALMSIRVQPFRDTYPLFSDDELKRFSRLISIALSKATPADDVEFLSMGQHGGFGILAPTVANSGRVFFVDGKLNVILGLTHKNFLADYLHGSRAKPVFHFGSRRNIAQGVKIVDFAQSEGRLIREDWVALSLSSEEVSTKLRPRSVASEGALPAASSSSVETLAEALARKSEARLKALQRLKEQNAISDEEYRQKRAEILKDL